MDDSRKVFDTIPEEFDKWRPRYCPEAFADLIEYTDLGPGKAVLEIGPGTGQATEPILKTGCDYLGVELGEHLAALAKQKFSTYDNFHIVNDDFVTHDPGLERFDLVYSAATIQWIPEAVAFPKVYNLLKSGGTLAMMLIHTDEKSADEELYNKIQEIYKTYFRPENDYNWCVLTYANAANYGFVDFERRDYYKIRELTADDYVSWISTHAPHITQKEPYRSKFFENIHEAIVVAGNKITITDNIILYLTKKP